MLVLSVGQQWIFAAASAKIPKDDTVAVLMRQSAGIAATGSAYGAASRQVQSSNASFDSPLLHIEVRSISRSEDKRTITLSLEFANVSEEDLLLTVDKGAPSLSSMAYRGGGTCSRLVDDKGNASDSQEVSGLTCTLTPRAENPGQYSSLPRGSRSTVTFVYGFYEPALGSSFSFSAGLLRHLGGKDWQRLSVGIPNIHLVE